jgi:LysR family transcriptional regulator, pca operon transcriptional activator
LNAGRVAAAKEGALDTAMIMHPAIKLRHIRAFLDIAASGNLSSVAAVQGVTQPALSRSLAELEDLLGAKLFLREKRRLVLSEQGALFRHHASLALQSLEAGAIALLPDANGGSLRVGILPTVAARLFPRVALQFTALHPRLTLKIETGPHGYLLGQLRAGALDMMLGRMPDPGEMAGLTFAHLYEEDIVLVARKGHPLAEAPLAQLLQSSPVILPPEGAVIRRAVNDYLSVLGLTGLRASVETVALAVGRGILAASDSLWFISRGVVADELDRQALIEIPTGVRFLSGAVGVTRLQAQASNPATEQLQRLCLQEAAAAP